MNPPKNFDFKLFHYTRHVLEKADDRNINLEDVEYVIEYGKIVAEYPNDKPFASYLYLAFLNEMPLHVCFAKVTDKECRVITAYQPSLIIFEKDFKTKRKK